MTEIRPEAEAAAEWWASRLGNATHDLGRRDPDARRKSANAMLASALTGRAFTDEQREAFRRELAAVIEENLQSEREREHWRPDNPQWGSGGRAVYADYGPAPECRQAAERAGITLKTLDLPLKTCMWVNPGHVKVREGHGAEVVTVWGEEKEACDEVMFRDLPAGCFPFTIELLDPGTREPLWSASSGDGPGAIQIPAARELGAERVIARVTFADGTFQEAGGDGRE